MIRETLNALFGTTHDIQSIPMKNKHIIGITSLWMIIPVYYNVYTSASALLLAACIASTLFWNDPKGNSPRHKADKILAWAFCIQMILLAEQKKHTIQNSSIALLILYGTACFMLSHIFFKIKYYTMQLIAHLLFRYTLYWCAHALIVPKKKTCVKGFLIISAAYCAHIALLWHAIDIINNYWILCLITVNGIALVIIAHTCTCQ